VTERERVETETVEPRSGGRWHRAAVIAAMLAGALLLLSATAGMYPTPDAYVYYGLSLSLRETGSYVDHNLFGSPPHVKYPAGFPGLLALIGNLAPSLPLLLNVVGPVFLLIGAVLLGRRLGGMAWHPVAMIMAVAMLLANRHLQHYAWSTNSDVPYLGVIGASLWLFLGRHDRRGVLGWILVGVVLGFLATSVRMTGVAMLGAMGLWLLLRRCWIPTFAFGAGAAAGMAPWAVFVLTNRAHAVRSYFWAVEHDSTFDLAGHMAGRADYLVEGLGRILMPHLDRLLPSSALFLVLGGALLIVPTLYLALRRPRGAGLILLYLLANVAVILGTRFYTHQRYLYPLFFVLVFVLVQALFEARPLRRFGWVAAVGLLGWALAVSSAAVVRSVPREVRLRDEPFLSLVRLEESGGSATEKATIRSMIALAGALPEDVAVAHFTDGLRGFSYGSVLLPVQIGWKVPATKEEAHRILGEESKDGEVRVIAPRKTGLRGVYVELEAEGALVPTAELGEGYYTVFAYRPR
jgi:4-amino-4-deoxy-L-arabinose transferase-like glycosyltransferase